jgi:hypothetical protein
MCGPTLPRPVPLVTTRVHYGGHFRSMAVDEAAPPFDPQARSDGPALVSSTALGLRLWNGRTLCSWAWSV